jgi:hypothetical protein
VQDTLNNKAVYLDATPHASYAVLQGSPGYALLPALDYPTPENIKFIAPDVLQHHLILTVHSEMERDSRGQVTRSPTNRVYVTSSQSSLYDSSTRNSML